MAWKKSTATDYTDCLQQIKDFVTKEFEAGAVTAGSNTGNGIVYGASATENSVAETWAILCTTGGGDGVAKFAVSGSVSGAQAEATSGEPYSVAGASFIILGGTTDWAATDSFTFGITASSALWAVNEEDLASTQEYLLLQGVGGGSDEIFVGFRTQSNGTTYFNMEVSVFSGYVSGNTYTTQPGIQSYYSCMSNVCFDFWIIMTGRHIKVVSVIGTSYEHMYAGWFLPNATQSQYQYPAYVGGNTDGADQLVGGTADDHTAYWNGYGGQLSGAVHDGTSWLEINSFLPKSYGSFASRFPDLDNRRTIYPCEILRPDRLAIYGSLEGVYYVVNGDSALTPDDILSDGDKGYLVVQDAFRTGTTNVISLDLLGDA